MNLKLLKRLLCACLALLMLATGLVSCQSDEKDEVESESDKQTESETVLETESYHELYILRSTAASNSIASLSLALKEFFIKNTELSVSIKTDSIFTYEEAEGRAYLVLGETEMELSSEAAAEGKEGHVVFLSEGDSTVVYAEEDTLMWVGLQRYIYEQFNNGVLQIGGERSLEIVDLSECMRQGWKQPFAAYTHGQFDQTLYSCGAGADDSAKPSEMHLIQKTNDFAYSEYVERLESLGYKQVFNNYIDGNYYSAFTDYFDNYIYVYYTTQDGITGTVRAILDRNSTNPEEFCYTLDRGENSRFYLFNHNTTSEDTFLIHAADNSWIFVDGGVTMYNDTDPEGKYADALFNFMWERSNLKEGEKLTISCWYLSHAHRDHFLAFDALIRKYHDRIDLQRMLANVPDNDNIHSSQLSNYPQFEACMDRINEFYPDMMYLKAHTGMIIQIADVEFTILNTQEDLIDYWVNNRNIYMEKWIDWSKYKNDPNYASYRDGYKRYDYNNSSLITIISVAGLTVLETGDSYRFHEWTAPNYKTTTLRTDLIKAAHHFINEETVTYYKELFDHDDPFCFIINHTSFGTSTEKRKLLNSMSKDRGQIIVEASFSKIFGFQKVNGKIAVEEIPATYSWNT